MLTDTSQITPLLARYVTPQATRGQRYEYVAVDADSWHIIAMRCYVDMTLRATLRYYTLNTISNTSRPYRHHIPDRFGA